MDAVKPWWASKAILSAAAVLLVNLLPLIGVHVFSADDADLIGETADRVLTAGFALCAIYGRIAARARIDGAQQ